MVCPPGVVGEVSVLCVARDDEYAESVGALSEHPVTTAESARTQLMTTRWRIAQRYCAARLS